MTLSFASRACCRSLMVYTGLFLAVCNLAQGEERIASERLHAAIERGLKLLQRGADEYPTHRDCFSCHHQMFPLLAWHEARTAGLNPDDALRDHSARFTVKAFDSHRDGLGLDDIGGKSATASYGLLALDYAGIANETTTAMRLYLLRQQRADGSWKPTSHRPPLTDSPISLTAACVTALGRSSSAEPGHGAAQAAAQKWLDRAELKATDEIVWTLWAEQRAGWQRPDRLSELTQRLQQLQRVDGGWGQIPELPSDAYSTGEVLLVLQDTAWPKSSGALESGIHWLLDRQAADGSWHVPTRAVPFQEWFDNGDPYGKDQFISFAATGWSTAALARFAGRRPVFRKPD